MLRKQWVPKCPLLRDFTVFFPAVAEDRSKRFAAGELPFNEKIPSEHNVVTNSYWCIKPVTPSLNSAQLFLLGQILYLSQDGKPVRSSMCNCPNLSTASIRSGEVVTS